MEGKSLPLSNATQSKTNIIHHQGCAFGGIKGRSQLPDLVDDYMTGKLKVDEFITHRKPLARIADAFEDMKKGDCIRCVVNMREAQS